MITCLLALWMCVIQCLDADLSVQILLYWGHKSQIIKKKTKKTSANRSLRITTVRSSLTWQVDPKFHKCYWRDHLMWKYFPPLHIEIPDTVSGHISSFFLFDPMNFYEYHHSPAQNVHKLVRAREHDTGEFRRCGITPWPHCHLNLSRF